MRNLVASLAILGVFTGAVPASAVTVSGTYYEDTSLADCANAEACRMDFPLTAVSSGYFLTLTEIGCSGITASQVIQLAISISDNGSNVRRIKPLDPGTPFTTFSLSDHFTYKVAGGPPRVVSVSIQQKTTGRILVGCMITGTLSPQ